MHARARVDGPPNARLPYASVTATDLELAQAYYPILVSAARQKTPLSYGDLVDRAKLEYPRNPVVRNAIAVSTGRRLDVVRIFTRQRELPDLTSLVVNRSSGECGTGFTRSFDPVATREEVFPHDWQQALPKFNGFLVQTKAVIQPRKKLEAEPARELMLFKRLGVPPWRQLAEPRMRFAVWVTG